MFILLQSIIFIIYHIRKHKDARFIKKNLYRVDHIKEDESQ